MNNIKIITEHWGKINPLKIEDYVSVGGYEALKEFIEKSDSEGALKEVKLSRLSGRGGAGFLTGVKWEMVSAQKGEKYFV